MTASRDLVKDFLPPLALLFVLTAVVAVTGLDLDLESRFYLPGSGWIYAESPPWHFLYHYGVFPSIAIAAGALLLAVAGLFSARAYVYAVARACDAGNTNRIDAAGAILLASENAVQTCLQGIQALGGAGYTKDWPVERFLRDAKLYDIGAGTNEIRRFLIGRELVGE